LNGMEMMLKALGIDPKEIMHSIEQFSNLVIELNKKLDRIEENQKHIMEKLELTENE